MDPMIDPALLEEDARAGEENDLEDAEGELVDEMMEEQYASYGEYGVNGLPTEQPIMEVSNSFEGDYQGYYEYPHNDDHYPPPLISTYTPTAGPSRPREYRSRSQSSHATQEEALEVVTPIIPKKKGRPFKNNLLNALHTPNGHSSPMSGRGRTPGKTPRGRGGMSKNKGRPRLSNDESAYVDGPPDKLCSFCALPEERNRQGVKEKMQWCKNCKRSAHLSCLNMTSTRIREAVFEYDWFCQDCKVCEVCTEKGREEALLFCDGCDRGWHTYCLNPPLRRPPKGRWLCPKCNPAAHLATSVAPPSLSKGKERATSHSLYLGNPSMITPGVKSRGRPHKKSQYMDDDLDEDDEVFRERGSTLKSKSHTARRGRKPKRSAAFSDTDDETPPLTGMKIRLRVSSGGRNKTVEVESEEEKIPYGGVITGEDADTTKTAITDRDKELFEKARLVAESKLGGPPPSDDNAIGTPLSPAPSMTGSNGYFPSPGPTTPAPLSALHRPLRDRLLQSTLSMTSPGLGSPGGVTGKAASGAGTGVAEKIKRIRFGVYDIDTWYSAPYPEEYQHVPEGRLWLCEFCLKYMKSGFVSERHRMKCKARHPPGDEIYRKDNVSVFEVDGRKNKIYCQNLCLLAKMFLDHKTLYYDVEPFLFYVMAEVDELGARFVGYFSKEKRSPDNNVSCIMTLPVRQRKGWGQLLIDFSYLLSKKEERLGGPERPLSGLGEVTYKKYWLLTVARYLHNSPDDPKLEDIAKATSMTIADVYQTLKDQEWIEEVDTQPQAFTVSNGIHTPNSQRRVRGRGRGNRLGLPRRPARPRAVSASPEKTDDKVTIPERYLIRWDRDYVDALLKKHDSRGYLQLAPERLKYHPFLVTRNPTKPPAILASATLAVAYDDPAATLAAEGDLQLDTAVDGTGPTTDGSVTHEPEEIVQHGEDRATLALVAALSHESPQRSLRTRTGSELNTPAPNSVKRLRGSDRSKHSVSPAHRVVSKTLSNGHAGQNNDVNGSSEVVEDAQGADDPDIEDDHPDSDESDDPLRLGRGMNGTPKRPRKSAAVTETPKDGGVDKDGPLTSNAGEMADDVDMDAEGEEEDAEGEDEDAEGEEEEIEYEEGDLDADGEWEIEEEEEDAEGEDDEDYEE